jgi:hypothetical protein
MHNCLSFFDGKVFTIAFEITLNHRELVSYGVLPDRRSCRYGVAAGYYHFQRRESVELAAWGNPPRIDVYFAVIHKWVLWAMRYSPWPQIALQPPALRANERFRSELVSLRHTVPAPELLLLLV